MNLKLMIQENLSRLQHEKLELEQKLEKLPKGHLEFCIDRKGKVKHYTYSKGKRHYIKKGDYHTAELLVLRNYYDRLLKECLVLIDASEAYLRKISAMPKKSAADLLVSPVYRQMLANHLQEASFDPESWMNASYKSNPRFPEDLKIKTPTGGRVRTKSELIIMNALHENHIPFRYECALDVNGTQYFPDFIIIHPRTGKIFIWEHCGRMDDPAYVQKNLRKFQDYIAAGYIPNKNLIITTETADDPLDIQFVYLMIQYFFMD